MSQRTIEVRVGILILLSLALLAGFIVVMGGLSLQPSFRVNVEFDNPGGLKTGAPVKLAGMKIGRISAIEFRGGEPAKPGEPPPPMVRVVANIEDTYRKALHTDSKWFVTTQGVLGELFLAVEPGSLDQPVLSDGAVVQGVSPPRLDLLLSESYELLHKAYLGITKNEQKISETFDGLHRTLKGTGDFFEKNGDKLDSILENLDQLSVTANETLLSAREKYVDGEQVNRILHNIDGTTTVLNQQVGPTIEEARVALGDFSRVMSTLGSEEQVQRYVRITRDVEVLAEEAKAATADARGLIDHVKAGKGTVGALIMDEALYDDIQEMLRDLKHNPWKFFWRE